MNTTLIILLGLIVLASIYFLYEDMIGHIKLSKIKTWIFLIIMDLGTLFLVIYGVVKIIKNIIK